MVESSPKGLKTQWEKGEIAHYEQFLLFPLCFHKSYTPDMSKQGLVWERVNRSNSVLYQFQSYVSCITVTAHAHFHARPGLHWDQVILTSHDTS